ncbi:MSCRAMM family protein [Sphingobacterium sp. UBA5996]|uniref:MSCRAMM family protein n=2 Tax=unclassified Sphingobacterium TaxID=2609468 RepID=UPI0025FE7FB0|nr:carboxypeptidase-like regulatory domain-containing protein [Sphingobacterium sp. UBA5996]
MSIRSHLIFAFLFCSSAFFLSIAKSQQRYDVAYHFEYDSISISASKTFSNKLTIVNYMDRAIELYPEANDTKVLQGLIKLPPFIPLKPHETKTFPLKYISDRQTISEARQEFSIKLNSEEISLNIQPGRVFFTKLDLQASLLIQPEQPEYFIDQSTGLTQFMVRIVNTGLIPLTFQLQFANLPSEMEIVGETLPMTLPAGEQSLLTFTARMRTKRIATDVNLTVTALEAGGKQLATCSIHILTVGNVTRFGSAMSLQNQPYNNMFALRYLNMDQNIAIYQLQGYGNLGLGNEKSLTYRMNMDYFRSQRVFNIYDSYLNYQTEKWGVKAGNIYENLDQYVNGRGVRASYKFDKLRSISAYAVQNNYFLWNEMNTFSHRGGVLGLKYAFKSEKNQESSLVYLHSKDNYRTVRNHLFSGKGYKDWSEKQHLLWEGGVSIEQLDADGHQTGLAAGINYTGIFAGFQVSSNNYYSSPYYVGLRRGLLQSDSRVLIPLEETKSVSVRMSFMDNRPSYQAGDRNYFFSSSSRIEIYELGYRTALGRIKVDLRPYWMNQFADYHSWLELGTDAANWKSSSLRTVADLNFFTKNHRFSLHTDYGYTYKNTAELPIAPFHSLRVSGNYDHALFGINTFVQINPYYLSDLFATYANANYRMYSLGPNTHFDAFAHNLQVQLAAMYSYYGFSRSNNFSLNGNVRWRMKNSWNLTADIFYTFIKGKLLFKTDPVTSPVQQPLDRYSFNNRQIRIGIEKSFGHRGHVSGYRLQLTCFDDRNNNGIRENDEPLVESMLIRVGKEVAITDEKGRVKFVDMEAGSFSIRTENHQGWIFQGPSTIVLTKNQSMDIPLVKTKSVKGNIQLVASKYLESKPDLSGIRITANDRQGKKYNTLTNEAGEYVFYLPIGFYRLTVETEGMPFVIENSNCEVEINAEGLIELPSLRYRDQRRKVGIKRF